MQAKAYSVQLNCSENNRHKNFILLFVKTKALFSPKLILIMTKVINHTIYLETDNNIGIYNLTADLKDLLLKTDIKNGQLLLFSRHTTTALSINEYEERLLEDIKIYLRKLAPETNKYLHNDLHLRVVPLDEPMNAHSHLMAMTLSNSEVIPIIEGNLGLGTWQSILFFELDGPRKRSLQVQFLGI